MYLTRPQRAKNILQNEVASHFAPCQNIDLSDASLNMADNSNALGLILPPAGGSISALFDLLCKLMGTLCYSVQMKSCHSFHLRNSCFKKLSKKFFPVNNIDRV